MRKIFRRKPEFKVVDNSADALAIVIGLAAAGLAGGSAITRAFIGGGVFLVLGIVFRVSLKTIRNRGRNR